MAALAQEVARSTPELKAAFERGFEEIVAARGGDQKETIFQSAAVYASALARPEERKFLGFSISNDASASARFLRQAPDRPTDALVRPMARHRTADADSGSSRTQLIHPTPFRRLPRTTRRMRAPSLPHQAPTEREENTGIPWRRHPRRASPLDPLENTIRQLPTSARPPSSGGDCTRFYITSLTLLANAIGPMMRD